MALEKKNGFKLKPVLKCAQSLFMLMYSRRHKNSDVPIQ